MKRTSVIRCAAFAAALAVSAACPSFGRENPAKNAGESTGLDPLCRVLITPKIGLPAECLLLAFAKGVYLVRLAEGDEEYKLQENEIQAVRFSPLKKQDTSPAFENRDRDESAPARRDRRAPQRRPFAALRERREQWEDGLAKFEPKFREMEKRGHLDKQVEKIEQRIREARDPESAGQAILELRIAHRVKGHNPEPAYWRRLLGSIADANVRHSPEVRMAIGFGQGRRGQRP